MDSDFDIPPKMPRRADRPGAYDPRVMGLWKVGRVIGEGATGRVRVARHSRTGEHAAVKIIDKTFFKARMSMPNLESEAETFLLAAEREITLMKLVHHPHVLRLHDVWETSSELFLVLEYAPKGELFDHLCARGRLPRAEALRFFQQIIGAVSYCHALNICHRDLKPENILLDESLNVKIADFGMAVWHAHDDSLLDTACGSPHYAAPEVISGTPYSGAAADIWSCGVILYALLLNRLPFDHEHIDTLLGLILAGEYHLPSDLDSEAKDLVQQMLNPDPARRITMSDILRHPFYLSAPLPETLTSAQAPVALELERPLPNREAINDHLLANMRALWPDLQEPELVHKLLCAEPTWQKAVYYLLVEYRTKHAASLDLVSEARVLEHQQLRRSRRQRNTTNGTTTATDTQLLHSGINTARTSGASTPQPHSRTSTIPPMELSNMLVSPSTSFPSSAMARASPRPVSPLPMTLSAASTHANGPEVVTSVNPASALFTSLNIPLPVTPELASDPVQDFLHQVFAHLQNMEHRSSRATEVFSPPLNAHLASPVSEPGDLRQVISQTAAPPPSPSNQDMDMAWLGGLGMHYDPSPHILSPQLPIPPVIVPYVDPAPAPMSPGKTKPLQPRPSKSKKPRIASSSADKENNMRGNTNANGSMRKYTAQEEQDAMADTSAWLIVEEERASAQRPALALKILSGPAIPLSPKSTAKGKFDRKRPPRLTLTDANNATSSLPTPTSLNSSPHNNSPSAALGWIGGLFRGKSLNKSKAATFQLISTRDAGATRAECERVLKRLGVLVHSPPHTPKSLLSPVSPTFPHSPLSMTSSSNVSASGSVMPLHCSVPPGDANAPAVSFRVEIRRPSARQFSVGYAVAAHLVREEGSLAMFKNVCNRFRRAWEFDAPVGIYQDGNAGAGERVKEREGVEDVHVSFVDAVTVV